MMPRACGFTLLELVVALALAGLLAALAIPATAKAMDAIAYQSTLRDLISDLRATRSKAIIEGRPLRFIMDLDQRRFGIEKPRRSIPDNLAVRIIVAEALATPHGGSIAFYPDGSSTGGSVILTRGNGVSTQVRVDWLLGLVESIPANETP